MWASADRETRLHGVGTPDQRAPFERDRDRILYTSAFHRLAGITQIVRAGELEIFHNRQQHTLKVAQVGRRLAQLAIDAQPFEAGRLGLHPEVVEAACLAHDLGHPPFGHVGEHVLDELVTAKGDPDGFEGNAQSFRVITKLSLRFRECAGLDLTRATLAACLKYPWLRDKSDPNKSKKWSAYVVDSDDFFFAREHHQHDGRTAEAALMDWADDIAYSVHDLEDFHRCGAIPWTEIFDDVDYKLVDRAYAAWHGAPADALDRLSEAFFNLEQLLFGPYEELLMQRYVGTQNQRLGLRNLTSTLIGRYIRAATLTLADDEPVRLSAIEQAEVLLLKQIARDYIISNPTLKAQQFGQKKIVQALYEIIYDESARGLPDILPIKLHYLWEMSAGERARFAADCVASLTEREAVGLHSRLTGSSDSSVLDPIVR